VCTDIRTGVQLSREPERNMISAIVHECSATGRRHFTHVRSVNAWCDSLQSTATHHHVYTLDAQRHTHLPCVTLASLSFVHAHNLPRLLSMLSTLVTFKMLLRSVCTSDADDDTRPSVHIDVSCPSATSVHLVFADGAGVMNIRKCPLVQQPIHGTYTHSTNHT
jgi:hypothetical protein